MVLTPGNNARRADTENIAPTPAVKGAAASRLRTTLTDANRRRRRAHAVPRDPKQQVEQARRRDAIKPKSSTPLKAQSSATKSATKTSVPQPRKTIPIVLPKELQRPLVGEVFVDALRAVDPEWKADCPPAFLRDHLATVTPVMLASLGSVQASLSANVLPTEFQVVIHDLTAPPPSHMVAVFGPAPKAGPSKPRKVTLYPIHSLVLAAHCTNLPAFPPAPSTRVTETPSNLTLPVRSLCLPSPENYPHLAAYLYHKNQQTLLNALLPSPAPSTLDESNLSLFATRLGRTFTFEKLLLHTMMIHGLWQNACALGVVDNQLWETIDLAWEIMLGSLGVSAGKPTMVPATQASTSSSS